MVKLRELLRKVDLNLRPLQLGGRPEDNVDAMTTAPGAENYGGFGHACADELGFLSAGRQAAPLAVDELCPSVCRLD